MIPLLRLLGMLAPFLGIVAFCFLANIIRSFTDRPPASLDIVLLAFIVVGSIGWMCLAVRSERKDHRIRDFLFIAPSGPSDILVTRTSDGIQMRLPDEYPPAKVPDDIGGFMFGLLFFGGSLALIAFMLHNGSQAVPPAPTELRDPSSFLFTLPAIALIAFLAVLARRYNSHIELLLTPTELFVYSVYARFRWRKARIDLAPIRQFSVVRSGAKSTLQAESVDEPPKLLLQERDHDSLLALANLLARERALLDPTRGATLVAAESSPHAQELSCLRAQDSFTSESASPEMQVERRDRPLHSKIVLTRQETGVTLDFPLIADSRIHDRRAAGGTFKIAIGIWAALFACWGFCWAIDQPPLIGCFCPVAVLGAATLFLAACQAATTGQYYPHGLRQLSITDNLLIRTAFDQSKQVWYRQEIRTFGLVEDNVESTATDENGSSYPVVNRVLRLVVELHNGEKAILLGISAGLADYRPKAELEWIATQLRLALQVQPVDTPLSSQAIPDTRISSASNDGFSPTVPQ